MAIITQTDKCSGITYAYETTSGIKRRRNLARNAHVLVRLIRQPKKLCLPEDVQKDCI